MMGKPGRKGWITKPALEAAIEESCGTQTSVATRLGVHHSTVQKCLNKWPELKPIIESKRQVADAYISDIIYRQAMEGDIRAIEVWKKYVMGIGIRLQVSGSDAGQALIIQTISYKDVGKENNTPS
jgi:hypothetical protein